MSTDRIEIEEIREAGSDGGSFMGYYCRGHVDQQEFAIAANKHGGHEYGWGYDTRYVEADKVKHIWWRTVPIASDPGQLQFVPSAGPGKGAWAATVFDAPIGRYWYTQRQRIKDYDQGRLRGIEEAISWAINLFQWSADGEDQKIRERILNSWTNYGRKELEDKIKRENAT